MVTKVMIKFLFLFLIIFPFSVDSFNYKWSGKGKLYDERNQYYVACRLDNQERVEPFFGEDSVKCHYICQDKEYFVITTHSDYICERQVMEPRGFYRDWRNK